MAKNMTRKGLAIGAGAALLSAGLVATPAVAAETLSLAPTAGTSYKVLTSTQFKLTASFAGSESSAAVDTLKYLVTNSSGATMAFNVVDGGTNAANTSVVVTGTSTAAAATATSVVVDGDGTNAMGSRSGLDVSITPVADTSADVTVQAFLDINGNNAIDSNEATSPARTIQFVDHASVAATATLSADVGAGTLSATVSIPGFNYDQLDSDDVEVEFYRNNTIIGDTVDTANSASGTGHTAAGAAVTPAQRTNPIAASWSSADAKLSTTLYVDDTDTVGDDNVYTLVANSASNVYSAKVRLNDGSATVLVADSAGAATPSAGEVDSLSAITEGASASTDGSDNIRSGSGSFVAKTTVTPNTGKAKAGNVVTFTVTETSANSLNTAATVSAGGNTLSNSNIATVQKFTVDVVSDADGVASLPISYAGITDGKTFDVSATALDTDAVKTASAITYTAVDSDIVTGKSDVYGGEKQSVIGQSFSVTYTIVDTFGQVPSGIYRAVVSENSGTANYLQTVNFVNGKATFTQSENATAAGTYTLTARVDQQNTDGTWDETPTDAAGAVSITTTMRVYATDPAVSSVSVSANDDGTTSGGAALDLELDDTYVGDADLVKNTATVPTLATNNIDDDGDGYDEGVATLTWTVKSSTGEALIGEPITVSSTADLQFTAASDKLWGVGSISGTTNSSGQFAVKVYSNFAGKHTISAVAGGITKTDDLTFRAAKDDTATAVTVTQPEYTKEGSTFKVTVQVSDKYGNSVTTDTSATNYVNGTTDPTFSVAYDGPGLIVGGLPTKTDKNGQASFSVLLGANDSGAGTTTVSYDADGTATASAAVTVTATTTVGEEPADQKVNAGSFKGYVAVYARGYEGQRLSAKIGNDWVIVDPIVNNQEDGTLHRTVDFTGAGVDIAVRIYIDRVLIDTINLTTK